MASGGRSAERPSRAIWSTMKPSSGVWRAASGFAGTSMRNAVSDGRINCRGQLINRFARSVREPASHRHESGRLPALSCFGSASFLVSPMAFTSFVLFLLADIFFLRQTASCRSNSSASQPRQVPRWRVLRIGKLIHCAGPSNSRP